MTVRAPEIADPPTGRPLAGLRLSARRPPAAAAAALYRAAGLARPVDDLPRLDCMFADANVVWSAWDGERLVGVLRGWTDGAFDGYVCDLAIDPGWQGRGLGRELLRRATAGDPEVQWVLRASAVAARYYEHLGWQPIANGWFWRRER
jgi:ribosomal protein S18 acetylase RimI-like enzyme